MVRPETVTLRNGIQMDVISTGDQQASRIDVITEGGRCDGQGQMVSELLAAVLREGTRQRTAREIAEELDFNGAWLNCDASSHNISLSLYSVNRNFDRVVPLLAEIAFCPSFPEHEFGNLKTLAINRLRTNNEKVAFLAAREFALRYFGESHNMGSPADERTIAGITTAQLAEFHSRWTRPANTRIILSGLVTDRMIRAVDGAFGETADPNPPEESASDKPRAAFEPQTAVVDKPNALQSAIRIGIPAIARSHPDYIPLRILTTAFGGYFGSRLMTNIREDKGYTYGISAGLLGYRNNSLLSISSQCDKSYTWQVVEEIKREMEKLKDKPMPTEELERVRSSMLADLARSLDTPFSVADYFASTLSNRIAGDYFDRQVDTINGITAARLQEMARRYFSTDRMLIAVAGDGKTLRQE